MGIVTFQPLSPEQANPFLYGMQSMSNALNTQAQTRAQNILNQYLPQSEQERVLAAQLANQKSQAELPYAGPQAQANVGLTNAQAGYYGQEAKWLGPRSQAEIGLQNAQAGYYGKETEFLPFKYAIDMANTQRMANRFGPAFDLAKTLQAMPQATRSAWIAQNQEAYNQMMADMANGVQQRGAGMGLLNPDFINQYLPGALPSSQNNSLFNSALSNAQANPTANLFSAGTPDQVNQMRRISEMAANNALTTAATRRQMEGALQVEGIMNSPDFQNQAQNAALYAGAIGKGQAAIDAISQQNPKAYEDYLSFKNQTMTLLANRIKTLDAMGATEGQREELHNLYKKTADALTSNPGQFIDQLNNLGRTLSAVAKSVQKSATPAFDVDRLSGFQDINNPFQQTQSDVTIVQTPDGKKWSIPTKNLPEALKRGAKEVK